MTMTRLTKVLTQFVSVVLDRNLIDVTLVPFMKYDCDQSYEIIGVSTDGSRLTEQLSDSIRKNSHANKILTHLKVFCHLGNLFAWDYVYSGGAKGGLGWAQPTLKFFQILQKNNAILPE